MKEHPITVCIAVYNMEAYIGDTITSVLNQDYRDFTLLIIDDGSKDRTIDIIRSFDDPRIVFIADGVNRGIAFRRNQLVSMTRTKYLAWLDGDDIMSPERLGKQLSILESNPRIDVLGTNAYIIDRDNNIKGIRFRAKEPDTLIKVSTFVQPSVMAKTEWFRANPYDENAVRFEDAELWYRAGRHSAFMAVNEPLLFYREFGGEYYKKYIKGLKAIIRMPFRYLRRGDLRGTAYWSERACSFAVKTAAYRVTNLLGKEDILIKRRSQPITEQERLNATEALSEALAEKIPVFI